MPVAFEGSLLWYADAYTACMNDPSPHHKQSQGQAGTQTAPALAPILKRRRAAPTSPPALGAIPFKTARRGASTPSMQGVMPESPPLPSQADMGGAPQDDDTLFEGTMEDGGERGLEGVHGCARAQQGRGDEIQGSR